MKKEKMSRNDVVSEMREVWIEGCGGLKYAASFATADVVIFRFNKEKKVEVLIGKRGSCKYSQEGLPMISIGGFIDLTDEFPEAAAWREQREEVYGIKIKLIELGHWGISPLCVTGPVKFNHKWDPVAKKAVNLGVNPQRKTSVTGLVYLAEWLFGEPKPTKEVSKLEWRLLEDLIKEECVYAFDMAKVLEAVARYFKLI